MRYVFSALGALLTFLFLILLILWFVLSLGTSAIKVASNNCGEEFGIEVVVGGNLFCPRK